MQECQRCSKPFEQVRDWQKFCSDECQTQSRTENGRAADATRRHRASWSPEKLAEKRRKNAERTREWNASEHGKRMKRDYALKQAYGIGLEQLESMIAAQGGNCPICSRSISAMGKGLGGCAVDHDHDTGAVRGILCQTCNAGLGAFLDDAETLERAALYLKKGG